MWPFGGESSGAPRRIPTERVVTLSSQGMSQEQIINTLKDEGYRPSEVDAALKQALKGAASGPPRNLPPAERFETSSPQPPAPVSPEAPQRGLGPPPSPVQNTSLDKPLPPPPGKEKPSSPPSIGNPDVPALGMPALPGEPGFGDESVSDELEQPILPSPASPGARAQEPLPTLREPLTKRESAEEKRRMIEELVEGIVEEKWSGFRMEIDDIRSRFNDISARLSSLEQGLHDLREEKKSAVGDLDKKIESYTHSISEISSRMEAMERALKDTMTPMMQTMRSLSNAVKSLKKSKEASEELEDTE